MKQEFLTITFIVFALKLSCQSTETISKFNFNFESLEYGIPAGWNNYGGSNYTIDVDSITRKNGKYSATIEFKDGNPDFKAWTFIIPDNYAGKEITLSGYIKTENVIDGYAGLWMRIDPSIAFDNMNKNGVVGTTDWTKYEITLEMNPDKTKQIVLGGLLVGKGKMWIDNLSVLIDGKDIHHLTPIEKKVFPAENDNEFDQGSQIIIDTINKNQVENLKTLGLIWGFLKYYHPNIALGEYNWDYELFRIMPKVLTADSKSERDNLLINWIKRFGQFSHGEERTFKSAETKITPDLEWISNSAFTDELTTTLLNIKNANRPEEHYYIGLQPGVGNPEFKNENSYSSMIFPDVGYRLLALYRYWNIIQYYFPYKNLIEEDWKTVLDDFIPKFINAKDETEYTLVVLELIGRVHDTHANIWGGNPVLRNYFGTRRTSVKLSFIENKAVVTGFVDTKSGEETGLEAGDVILSINNKPVDELIKETLKYFPASNHPTQLRDIASHLLRTNDSIINIEILRNEIIYSKILNTYSTKDLNFNKISTDTCFKLINKDIGYINHGTLKRQHLPEIWKNIQNTKGLIIDIRNYPSDFPIFDLSNYLMPMSTPFVKFTNGSIENPGLFTYTPTLNAGEDNRNYYKGKVTIIINEISQSSAEYHTMAYSVHPNAIIIGSTTAGADGNVSQFYLPGGISTMISGIGVYYPDGKETQRIGIVPDIECKPTIKGIQESRDELMEKALEIINGQ